MKHFLYVFFMLFLITSCKETEQPEADIDDLLTGESAAYDLFTGSEFNHSGTIVFKQKKDSTTLIEINLDGPKVNDLYPVHLHFGSYSDDADIAAFFTPVDGDNGTSQTDFSELADFTTITYRELVTFDGHIKIHFDDQENQDVILAYASIGTNPNYPLNGRVPGCKSSLKE